MISRFVNGRRLGCCVRREDYAGALDNRDQHPELVLPDRPLA